MRKILCFVLCILCCSSGCNALRDRAHVGWHFEIVKPPSIDTDTPVLLQYGGRNMNVQPVGTAAGPITHGAFTQDASQTVPLGVAPASPTRQTISQSGCGTVQIPHRLTCEEWCQLQRQIQYKPTPAPVINAQPGH